MAVHLTRIYTRTGDDGTSGLSDFSRVDKNDPRLIAYADCDETNAAIGTAVTLGQPRDELRTILLRIQNDLFDAGADLSTPIIGRKPDSHSEKSTITPRASGQESTPETRSEQTQSTSLRITEPYITQLEQWCDHYNEQLPALTSFILPGGTPLAALLHLARTVTRRAERSAWMAVKTYPDSVSPLPAKYLNRLSDLLFILSRIANPEGDVLWKPGGR